MGHQKKLFNKFVATAATATLVATAIVPVASASFSDVEETHEFATYINTAVDAGYIKGYADGTFGINDNLKRSQVVIIIGRYLESLGYSSKATTSPWSDVTNEEVIKYGNIVKDAGVFTGYANGTLNGGGLITRENMAVVLDRLAKTVTGTSLAEVAKDIEDAKIADLASANPAYQGAIQALRDLGISTADNFNPKGNVKRGQFAKFIVTAIEKIDEIDPAVEMNDEIDSEVEKIDAIDSEVEKIDAIDSEVEKIDAIDQEVIIESVDPSDDTTFEFVVGETAVLPKTVDVIVSYSDGTTKTVEDLTVTWDEEVSTEEVVEYYPITGKVTFEGQLYEVSYDYTVVEDVAIQEALEALENAVIDGQEAVDTAADALYEAVYALSDEEIGATQALIDAVNSALAVTETAITTAQIAIADATAKAISVGVAQKDIDNAGELDLSYANDAINEVQLLLTQ